MFIVQIELSQKIFKYIGVKKDVKNDTFTFQDDIHILDFIECNFDEMHGNKKCVFTILFKYLFFSLKLDLEPITQDSHEYLYSELFLKYKVKKYRFFLSKTFGVTDLFLTNNDEKDTFCQYYCKQFLKSSLNCLVELKNRNSHVHLKYIFFYIGKSFLIFLSILKKKRKFLQLQHVKIHKFVIFSNPIILKFIG